ncbi:phage tail domain-containing protein [Staphylococcus ratti]|uniref:Phage tail family protein n=1 Tax=Staphylococcus ratti TaxID=2892440 RepID=A0ABY3PBK7_9STAP|nr:phage tail domain-containing protein [Staphylococcus ratti]UEX89685.1 phage tail family protein [Staphylococcus ratti]
MIAHDIEVIKNNNKYRISNNPFTYDALRVVSFNVEGAGYSRSFDNVERINGRFYNSTVEEKKKVVLVLRYDVSRMAYASHLKSTIQDLFSGHFYMRELATPDNSIVYESVFASESQKFEMEYVDGRQIYVGLVNEVSFDTGKIGGEITLEFETINLPYFESIGYSTDLERDPNMEKWAVPDNLPFNKSDIKRRYTFENVAYDDVYYNGSVPINQFNQDSVVEITLGKNVSKNDDKGFTFYMTHSNMIKIKGLELKAGDVIRFDGLHTYRNNLRIDNYNTESEQPVLHPGINRFKMNQVVQKIVFKHKIYSR